MYLFKFKLKDFDVQLIVIRKAYMPLIGLLACF